MMEKHVMSVQDRRHSYNVAERRVGMEKQNILHIISVCL